MHGVWSIGGESRQCALKTPVPRRPRVNLSSVYSDSHSLESLIKPHALNSFFIGSCLAKSGEDPIHFWSLPNKKSYRHCPLALSIETKFLCSMSSTISPHSKYCWKTCVVKKEMKACKRWRWTMEWIGPITVGNSWGSATRSSLRWEISFHQSPRSFVACIVSPSRFDIQIKNLPKNNSRCTFGIMFSFF